MNKKRLKIIPKYKAMSLLPKLAGSNSTCYYLDQDFEYFLKLKDKVSNEVDVKNLAGLFQKTFEYIRDPFLKEIGRINEQEDSIEWWGGQIASRNVVTTPLLLNTTYLFCSRTILNEAKGDLVLITDSPALSNCIASLSEGFGYEVSDYNGRLDKALKAIKFFAIFWAKVLYVSYEAIKIHKAASGLPKLNQKKGDSVKKRVVMRSWVTAGNFDSSSRFKDRNFGPLSEWLTDKGYEVWILPMFFNTGVPAGKIYSFLKNQKQPFLIPEHYLRFSDYLGAFGAAWRMTRKRLKDIKINNVDVTPIFNEALEYSGLMRSSLMLNLCGPMLKRMNEEGYEIDGFYYPFENNVPEKQFILYCRKYFPHKAIVGFQHTTFFQNQLGCNLAPNEKRYHPLPDKIICSGPVYLDLYKKAGLPDEILEYGPNLRHKNVYGNAEIGYNGHGIMLPLTFSLDLAFELIYKVKKALKDDNRTKIYIRSHPLLPREKLIAFLRDIGIKSYEFADSGIFQEWFPKIHVVISAGGSITVLEAVAAGVPVIRMVPDSTFFLDPFVWPEYPLTPAVTSEDIGRQILLIDDILQKDKKAFQVIAQEVTRQYFTKPTNENMKVFL